MTTISGLNIHIIERGTDAPSAESANRHRKVVVGCELHAKIRAEDVKVAISQSGHMLVDRLGCR